jgi:Flp pilus assembly protein CpaB
MSRRVRAMAFGAAALVCAALAAGIAGGYRSEMASQYGELQPVVVTRESLPARRILRPGTVERLLEVRRVPERFVPPDALADPAEAIGRAVRGRVPQGSYLVLSQLAEQRRGGAGRPPSAGPGRVPVEIEVVAAGAIGAPAERPARVDVVVTTDPVAGGPGRTYVAAENVRLLDLRATDAAVGPDVGSDRVGWVATLALDRSQALRLIQAESFSRQVRLIGRIADRG